MTFKHLSYVAGFLTLTLVAAPAWAVQTHGGAEGLVSHQIGHILFASGMGYLLLRLYHIGQQGLGWLEFKAFLWLIIAWNLLTFSSHWMNEFIATSKAVEANGKTTSLTIDNFTDVIYFLTKLDHLVLVPAFLFLLLALRKWRSQ